MKIYEGPKRWIVVEAGAVEPRIFISTSCGCIALKIPRAKRLIDEIRTAIKKARKDDFELD